MSIFDPFKSPKRKALHAKPNDILPVVDDPNTAVQEEYYFDTRTKTEPAITTAELKAIETTKALNDMIADLNKRAVSSEQKIELVIDYQKQDLKRIQHLEDEVKRAYILIALNMFAIVRMELGASTDRIINDALKVKRQHTGKGKLGKPAMELAATAAMLAGHVLSMGGLAAAGAVLVGVAKGTKAVRKLQLNAGSKVEDRNANSRQITPSDKFNPVGSDITIAPQTPITIPDILADKALNKYETTKEVWKNLMNNTQHKNTVAKIPYGSGGMYAITQDVKYAVSCAYAQMIHQVELEKGRDPTPNDVLTKLIQPRCLNNVNQTQHDQIGNLHPLTTYVLDNALKNLITNPTLFKKCKGKSTFGQVITASFKSTLGYAQHSVTKYYNDVRNKLHEHGSYDLGEEYFLKENQEKNAIYALYLDDGTAHETYTVNIEPDNH